MKRRYWTLIALAACALNADVRAQAALPPCTAGDQTCLQQAMANHPVLKLDYWERALNRPVELRIGAAPGDVVEYLNLDVLVNGFPNRPHAARLAPDFLLDLQNAFGELPQEVKRLVSAKLAGIYLIEDIGGTGYTEQIFDRDSNAVAGFIILDPAVLGKFTANAWATWKENTPFQAQPGYRLSAKIEDVLADDRRNAIQYILLRELGRVAAIGEKIHPSWSADPREIKSTADFHFFELSWRISNGGEHYESIFEPAFPQRKRVAYYFGAKLRADEMSATYDNLERTNFATLYAAQNPFDDFAESFANYVHTILMGRPFEVGIFRDGATVKVYKSCWSEPRCQAKRHILEQLLAPAR